MDRHALCSESLPAEMSQLLDVPPLGDLTPSLWCAALRGPRISLGMLTS